MTDILLLDNPLRQWLVAIGIAVSVLLLVALFKRVMQRRLAWMAERTYTRLDNALLHALQGTRQRLWLLPALRAGSMVLLVPERVGFVLGAAAMLSLLLQVGIWASRLVDFWSRRPRSQDGNSAAASGMAIVRFTGKLLVWAILVLVALDNLGVNVTAAVAGLGIGGIAVALAVQNILGDLFASLSIVIDKPFEVGDFVVVDDFSGSVEEIGLKSTRIRSLSGEQIVFPNADLLQSRLRNYKRMYERRATFRFAVPFATARAELEAIPALLQSIIEGLETLRFDRAHLLSIGASALEFEVVYWVKDPGFNLYADRQQTILLALLDGLRARGVALAWPTQALHVASLQQGDADGDGDDGDAGDGDRDDRDRGHARTAAVD